MSHNGSNPAAKALYYFQLVMVVLYIGSGLLLLFWGPLYWLADKPRKGVGIAMLVYGVFRGVMVWQKRKQIRSNDEQ